jgi:hypothetical protein
VLELQVIIHKTIVLDRLDTETLSRVLRVVSRNVPVTGRSIGVGVAATKLPVSVVSLR